MSASLLIICGLGFSVGLLLGSVLQRRRDEEEIQFVARKSFRDGQREERKVIANEFTAYRY